MSQTAEKLEMLRQTIVEKPPYVWGTAPLLPESTTLFFGHEGSAGRLNLLKPDDAHVELLVQACEPATFGQNEQDILDETYRKAKKLNPNDFAINIDLTRMQLIKIIQSGLLAAQDEQRSIRAELYKLNIYGPGSFFKAHKDTPRGESMFGSLVLVLPVPHKGGELLLRQGDQTWKYDSSGMLAGQELPSVGYVAFYGDIEHEVLPVESGHRITLTYNLFFDNKPLFPSITPVVQTAFETAFIRLLEDPTFLPDGGVLGYPLQYQYPVAQPDEGESAEFGHIIESLKGVDVIVRRVCSSLGLKSLVKVTFDLGQVIDLSEYDNPPSHILMDCIPHMSYHEDGYFNLAHCHGSIPTRPANPPQTKTTAERGGSPEPFEWIIGGRLPPVVDIWWLNQPDAHAINHHQLPFVSYGNEASLTYMYGNFCLIIDVGPFGSRETSHEEKL